MIDVMNEHIVPLSQVSLPGRSAGKRIHVATVHRWVMRGIRGIRLEAVTVGGRKVTSHEAIQRFAEALTARERGETYPTIRTSRQRQQQAEAAKRELIAEGVL